jgi:hypothetical protein
VIGHAVDELDKDWRAQLSDPEVNIDRHGRVRYVSCEGEATSYGRFSEFETAMMARLHLNELEDEEAEVEEDEITIDERTDDSERIVPKQPGEFHCSACFLLLPRGQLADEERLLCKDCV